ncbi:hypothetical protein OSB04_016664 [Centaurea solstitialis]|uniref:DUF4216 domain-containing protein n=1 Tax=Centaurea solstitialis TaxID=347529 RepID=A0AA38WJY5_9ASTR|nr:hypothetical protein OSB04_016664 [Centaurea solstitialis]
MHTTSMYNCFVQNLVKLEITRIMEGNQHAHLQSYAQSFYYGVLQEIWVLNYHTRRIPLFKCDWVNNRHGVEKDGFGYTLVELNRIRLHAYDLRTGRFRSQLGTKAFSIAIPRRSQSAIDSYIDFNWLCSSW